MTTLAPAAPAAPTHTGRIFPRVGALALMEVRALIRNKVALFNALALAPFMVLAFSGIIGALALDVPGGFTASIVANIVGLALLFVVYYNLTTTAVARREELMLKRLLTGQSSRGEVLVAMATPAFAVVLAQTMLGLVAGSLVLGPAPMTNLLLLVVGVVGGSVIFALLAYASTAFTRSVESAQLSTLPVLIGALLLSGLLFPAPGGPVGWLFGFSPLAPVVELVVLGLTGVTSAGVTVDLGGSFLAAVSPMLRMVLWIALGAVATNRFMRWEPRR